MKYFVSTRNKTVPPLETVRIDKRAVFRSSKFAKKKSVIIKRLVGRYFQGPRGPTGNWRELMHATRSLLQSCSVVTAAVLQCGHCCSVAVWSLPQCCHYCSVVTTAVLQCGHYCSVAVRSLCCNADADVAVLQLVLYALCLATLANHTFVVKNTFVKVNNNMTKFAQIVVKFTQTLFISSHLEKFCQILAKFNLKLVNFDQI